MALEAVMLVAGKFVTVAGVGVGVENDRDGEAHTVPAALMARSVKKYPRFGTRPVTSAENGPPW